jgi:hypothetical protein
MTPSSEKRTLMTEEKRSSRGALATEVKAVEGKVSRTFCQFRHTIGLNDLLGWGDVKASQVDSLKVSIQWIKAQGSG